MGNLEMKEKQRMSLFWNNLCSGSRTLDLEIKEGEMS
jgi:hypothetical protein